MLKNLKLVAFIVSIFALGMSATAQDKSKTEAAAQSANQVVGQVAQTATMTASLIDAEKNAKDKSATVEVRITGIELIDPALTNKKPMNGQGHLHYQVDDGPVIATTAPKLSFHGLRSGKHKIVVMLANNDNSPAGPQQTMEITVP